MTLQEANATLEHLKTADGVAAFLKAKGIKGHRLSSCDCPISNYLTGLVGRQVVVSGVAASETNYEGLITADQDAVILPDSVIDFIDVFDGAILEQNFKELVAA